jgi:hypothetical protein
MKWPFFSRGKSSDGDLVDRYKNLRQAARDLNLALIRDLPRQAVPECGKKLGLYKAGTLILNHDDEIAILYDFCLHHYRRAGKTAVERAMEQPFQESDPTQLALLAAMGESIFSVYALESVRPRRGAALRDLIYDRNVEIVDLALSETGQPGSLLAGRLICVGGIVMSSGTMIPVAPEHFEKHILPIVGKFFHGSEARKTEMLSPAQQAALESQILRTALRMGGETTSFYTDMEH